MDSGLQFKLLNHCLKRKSSKWYFILSFNTATPHRQFIGFVEKGFQGGLGLRNGLESTGLSGHQNDTIGPRCFALGAVRARRNENRHFYAAARREKNWVPGLKVLCLFLRPRKGR